MVRSSFEKAQTKAHGHDQQVGDFSSIKDVTIRGVKDTAVKIPFPEVAEWDAFSRGMKEGEFNCD